MEFSQDHKNKKEGFECILSSLKNQAYITIAGISTVCSWWNPLSQFYSPFALIFM